jgi:hypothetical protein
MIDRSETGGDAATLVYIGPGSRDRVGDYLVAPFRHILVLDPQRESASKLAAQLAQDERTRVSHGALALQEGEGELLVWNLERLSSLKPGMPLLSELLPGSRVLAKEPVPLVTPAQLTSGLEEPSLPIHLVIAFAGEEQGVLETWKAHGLLEHTCSIEVHGMQEQLFEGAASSEMIEAWLCDEGFAVTSSDLGDPDWPILHFRPDIVGKKLTVAQGQISQLEQALSESQAREAAVRSELEALEKKAEWRKNRIVELEKALGEQEALVVHAELERQKAHSDLGIATRMQALVQADLNNLRSRFESSQEIRAAQEALLAKLTPQLQHAADQLRRLQFEGGEGSTLIVSAAASLLGREPSVPPRGNRGRSKKGSNVSSTTR